MELEVKINFLAVYALGFHKCAQSVFIILSLSGQHGHIIQTFSSIRNMKLTVLQFSKIDTHVRVLVCHALASLLSLQQAPAPAGGG